MDEDWRNTFRIFEVTPGGRARGVWPQRVQNPFYTNIVMLHIKSKVMKSRIKWYQNSAPGAKILPRGHVWGSLEVKK